MAARGKCFPRQITLDGLIAFRAGWQQLYPSSLTRQKEQERLRASLRYCHDVLVRMTGGLHDTVGQK
jgi:hypothetical protein